MKAGILVTAPAGFEVSTDDATYSSTVTVGAAGAIPPTVYVRLSANMAVGSYSGTLVLSSTGAADVNVAILVSTVAPACTSQAQSQTVVDGTSTAPVNFTCPACTYTWVNDTPGIGLPANGTGNIPSFTAQNKGAGAVTATITATPVSVPLPM